MRRAGGPLDGTPPRSWVSLLRRVVERLELRRPLTFLDLESTGLDPRRHRIVEICLARLEPEGGFGWLHTLVRPSEPIPAAATEVHGIDDDDVADAPSFAELSSRVVELLRGTDLAGYNLRRFDLPLLHHELRRCRRRVPWEGAAVVDVWAIFVHHERRDLRAAHRFYGAGDLADAHDAAVDVRATMEVLVRQTERYPGLSREPGELARLGHGGRRTEPRAWLRLGAGGPELCFGRYRGRPLRQVAAEDPSYLRGWLDSGLPQAFRDAVAVALGSPPAAGAGS